MSIRAEEWISRIGWIALALLVIVGVVETVKYYGRRWGWSRLSIRLVSIVVEFTTFTTTIWMLGPPYYAPSPWVLGILGTLAMEVVPAWQKMLYGRLERETPERRRRKRRK